VPKRVRHRDPTPVGLPKVMLRGTLAGRGSMVERGNHGVTLDGRPVPMRADPRVTLAHYPARTGWQMLVKALVGRLKVLAAGTEEEARDTSAHYTGLLAFLRANPRALMRDEGYMTGAWSGDWLPPGLVDDPLDYRGGDLRATPTLDPAGRAVQSLLSYLEDLAREHGRMIAAVPAAAAFARSRSTSFEAVM